MDCFRYTIDEYIIEKNRDEDFSMEKLPVAKKSKRFWTCYRQALDCSNNPENHYNRKRLAKRSGEFRNINIPDTILKNHQRYINEKFLNSLPISEYAFAYCTGKSIKDVANIHFDAHKDTLLCLDIKDFFGSISAKRLYYYFKTHIRTEEEFIVFLTNICTLKGILPQGAPTSPTISNLLMYNFDEEIGAYAKGNNITYTRYSDDILFSFNREDISEKQIIFFVNYMLTEEGFKLNQKKTKVLKRNSHNLSILGINTNDKLQVPSKYRKDVRQCMHFINTYGLKDHMSYIEVNNTDYGRVIFEEPLIPIEEEIQYLQSLLGRVNYILFVNRHDSEMKSYHQQLCSMIATRKRRRDTTILGKFSTLSNEDIPF